MGKQNSGRNTKIGFVCSPFNLILIHSLQVTIMLFSFNEEEQRVRSERRVEVMHEINNYNRRFSGEPREVS